MRRAGIATALALALGCASSASHERFEQDYALRWQVDVTSKPEDVKACRRVASLDVASLPCMNILHDVSMGGTECARFWTVDHGGDTLLVKKGNAGDVYVCKAPLRSTETLEAAK
jgi:hypothetical protein